MNKFLLPKTVLRMNKLNCLLVVSMQNDSNPCLYTRISVKMCQRVTPRGRRRANETVASILRTFLRNLKGKRSWKWGTLDHWYKDKVYQRKKIQRFAKMLRRTKMLYTVLHGFSNLPQGIVNSRIQTTPPSLHGMFFSAMKVGTEAKQGDWEIATRLKALIFFFLWYTLGHCVRTMFLLQISRNSQFLLVFPFLQEMEYDTMKIPNILLAITDLFSGKNNTSFTYFTFLNEKIRIEILQWHVQLSQIGHIAKAIFVTGDKCEISNIHIVIDTAHYLLTSSPGGIWYFIVWCYKLSL